MSYLYPGGKRIRLQCAGDGRAGLKSHILEGDRVIKRGGVSCLVWRYDEQKMMSTFEVPVQPTSEGRIRLSRQRVSSV